MLPWFQWETIQLGPLQLQVWGMFVACGMLLSTIVISRRAHRGGISSEQSLDLALWMIVFGFLGSRLFHILFYEPAFFWAHPSEIVKIWHGGLSSFGGLAGAVVAFFVFVRKHGWQKKLLPVADLYVFGAVFGWVVGRMGCFVIHDHLGVHSNCPLALHTPTGPRLDMALLEIVGMIPLAILFFVSRKKSKPDGWFTSVLFIYYGILRFILDFFRATDIPAPDTRYLGLTPGQYCAILLILCGVFLATTQRKKHGEVA